MSNIKVKVNQSPQVNVRVGQQSAVKIASNLAAKKYVQLLDVDTSNLKNGDIAVYNSITEKFVSQSDLVLDNLTVNQNAIFNGPTIFNGLVNFENIGSINLDGGIY